MLEKGSTTSENIKDAPIEEKIAYLLHCIDAFELPVTHITFSEARELTRQFNTLLEYDVDKLISRSVVGLCLISGILTALIRAYPFLREENKEHVKSILQQLAFTIGREAEKFLFKEGNITYEE